MRRSEYSKGWFHPWLHQQRIAPLSLQGVTSWFVFYLLKEKGVTDAAQASVLQQAKLRHLQQQFWWSSSICFETVHCH